MNEQRVSSRYARAIFETAKEAGKIDLVYKDLKFINDTIDKSRDLRLMISSQIIQYWKKERVFKEIFENNIDSSTLDFLLLIADKRRERLIMSIYYQYEILYNKLNGRLPIQVVSAIELSEDLKKKIVSKMQENTGKIVLTDFLVDPALKGGLKIKVEDWVFDSTIKNQLETLFNKLTTG